MAAIHHAWVLSINAAVPAIRKLEFAPLVGSTRIGTLRRIAVDTLNIRLKSQFALRRLGCEPVGLPPYKFRNGDDQFISLPEVAKRDPAAVSEGMTQLEVFQRLGIPDYVGHRYCDYHTGLADGYTLRVLWRDETDESGQGKQVLDAVKRISPPAWLGEVSLTRVLR